MIKGTFQFSTDMIEVVIDGNNLMFMDISSGMITTPEGIRISKDGVEREFPDLVNDDKWKKKAIERLKNHIKEYKNENEKLNYVKNELESYGYKALFKQKAGFRPTKF